MRPINFPEQNVVYAKDQKEYNPLPSHKDELGVVTACWGLDFLERLRVLFTGKIWWRTMTFGLPLQPQQPSVWKPPLPRKRPYTERNIVADEKPTSRPPIGGAVCKPGDKIGAVDTRGSGRFG